MTHFNLFAVLRLPAKKTAGKRSAQAIAQKLQDIDLKTFYFPCLPARHIGYGAGG
ncbi:hypothetical protein OAR31_05760 [Candidatus Marinimicrobia bacterium]|nr:hypothetical protein [Candidatus Neomarinimicrobiota bacterium]